MKRVLYGVAALAVLPSAAFAQSPDSQAEIAAVASALIAERGYERPQQPPQANEVIKFDPDLDRFIAPGVNVEVLAGGFNATEGPMWRDGKLWVSDQRNDQILALDAKGAKTVIAGDTGWKYDPSATVNQGPNGEIPDKGGAVLVARQGFRDIARRTPDGKFTVLVSAFEGKRLNSPNDLVYAPDGTLFFTDPAYSLPGGMDGPNSELHFEGVYSFRNGKLRAVVKDLVRPNGIGVSPDGKTLYVSTATPSPRIKAYDIQKDGGLGSGRDFYVWPVTPGVRGGVDGLKVDAQGNLWATGLGGVNVITRDAKNLGRIQVASHGTSNVAFGGPDGATLFITGGPWVYRIQTLAKGQRPLYQKP
jgi:gluconolactonase